MRLRLLAVGRRPPRWVREGMESFAERLPGYLRFELVEIAPGEARRGGDVARARLQEAERLRAAAGEACVVALDERGDAWNTDQLARRLRGWLQEGRDTAFLVGGADGLDPSCLAAAEHAWSLSALTLPHMLVRVIVAEQLYRAWTLLEGHPYHRG
ncbi:23S rRNA (pseudouridine(1915)-N(3))-methyltransferase RlmH [Sediminicurvatus halobius]|uniref:Ribosomal RNA large subunit methyltransferase H n=1 Tax=Sediminicurvatus halobius TaxID=2182432 RepID=A0A2U2N4E6_9GAMM|nr:23S rRNA (pseudouridine(1915)-N(3))-methyltransferase RlmH [Spiribacter halobius]PWG64101.1 23S rRNA (pseudouridine(1915)-N(3))-methyltransferase RlmH [Spiribacter halobius]PWG65262.1 23S rRNA (pseudouridine(1915)-N(3))-methyltransferase RlmH [Spiribacter halobius]UEX78782.1 23S rRNA (pseudouridine(1915)-N(3))-methyltransferase RlmH [Spiribacter halobius]